MKTRSTLCAVAALGAFALSAPAAFADSAKAAVVKTYGDIAQAMYADSHSRAKDLQAAIDALIAGPSKQTHAAAKRAWLKARRPYQQTEVYRFGNKIVDEWEGKVNAWPLDEGLIDYVDASYGTKSDSNPLYTANVIANKSVQIGGKAVDTSKITKELLSETLHEAGKVEANVATGYHAVEFLLWGQDLNGTEPGAGKRFHTDYIQGKGCTNGNCDRRAAYLKTVTDLLVDDLAWMAEQWKAGGAARKPLEAAPDDGIAAILTGIGSLSYGELAGERMKLGLLLHDPEEEHDCFSDNTHNSHYYDIVGIRAVYFGSYTRIDGKVVTGPSLATLVKKTSPDLAAEMKAKLDATFVAARAMKERAEKVEAYDQMIGDKNPEGNATVQKVIDGLTAQTKTLERIVAALKLKPIKFEGSDSLDEPKKVFEKKKS